MNIVIIGAGSVGFSIAEILCEREENITMIDHDPKRVQEANDKLDVRAIVGSGSQSSALFQAGVSSADICLAVTGNDEINILSASMAKAMGARRSIARVYAPVFRDLSTFDYQSHFNVDRMLSLEHLMAMELARNIRDPGSVVVEQFSRGELSVQEILIGQAGNVTSKPLKDLGLAPNIRIGTIRRENRMWIASAEDQFEIGDRVTIFSRSEDVNAMKTFFNTAPDQPKRVVIAGGGETGFHLASALEREGYRVMLMESDEARCQALATQLANTKIIHCDALRRENLEEERVGNADVFVACTGNDENNLVLGVEATELGAKKVMANVGRPDYVNMVGKLGIDRTVSRREVMAKAILAYLTQGNVVSRAKLPGGLINIIELEVEPTSVAAESELFEMGLPDRCLVVAIVSRDTVRVPGGRDKMEPGDHAILLVEEDVVEAGLSRFRKQ